MEKEKIILELFELEELIKIETNKIELKKIKTKYTKLNNKLKEEEK